MIYVEYATAKNFSAPREENFAKNGKYEKQKKQKNRAIVPVKKKKKDEGQFRECCAVRMKL